MGKRAWIALCLALLLPVGAYFIVKNYSQGAVDMPMRYYFEGLDSTYIDGELKVDSVFQKISDFRFTNQLGEEVGLSDVPGKIAVVDFFFTRCPSICPALTRSMKKLQDSFNDKKKTDTSIVQFVSISVDPKRDSVDVLKNYADRFGVNHDNWWLLTGDKKEIYELAYNDFKLGTVDDDPNNIIHSDKLVLIDKNRIIRGYYSGLDSAAMSKLARDIVILMLEKDRTKKRKLFK